MCSISVCNDFFWPLSAILSTMEKPIVFIYFLPDNLWTVPPLGPMAPSRSLFVHTWTNLSVFRFLQSSGRCGKLGQTRVIHVVTHWCVNCHKCLRSKNLTQSYLWFCVDFSGRDVFIVYKNEHQRHQHRFVTCSYFHSTATFATKFPKCSVIRLDDVLEKPLADLVRTFHNHQDVDSFNFRTSVSLERCSSDCKMEVFWRKTETFWK